MAADNPMLHICVLGDDDIAYNMKVRHLPLNWDISGDWIKSQIVCDYVCSGRGFGNIPIKE